MPAKSLFLWGFFFIAQGEFECFRPKKPEQDGHESNFQPIRVVSAPHISYRYHINPPIKVVLAVEIR